MVNSIADYVLNVIGTLLVLGHIEIRREDGSPAQHVTGWFDIEQLKCKPIWIQYIAHAMAKTVGQRVRRKLKTVILTGDSPQAFVFGNMLAAKLENNDKCVDIQTARMRVSSGKERHCVILNHDGYLKAERIVITDIASFTLETLQQLLHHVKHDWPETKRPEIVIACGLRLCRDGIDPSTSTLTGATVCIGYEHIIQQVKRLNRCTQCSRKVPVTHVYKKDKLNVYDAKKEAEEKEAQESVVKALKEIDTNYRAAIAAGEHPTPPMTSMPPLLGPVLVDPKAVEQLAQLDIDYLAAVKAGNRPRPPTAIVVPAITPSIIDPEVIARLAQQDAAFQAIPPAQRTPAMVPKGRPDKS